MTTRNIAVVTLVIALIGLGIYWFVTRPTQQENDLEVFLDEFHMGHFEEAQVYTLGNDFYSMAAATSVRDTDGTRYLIGDYYPESRRGFMQLAIETYVRQHIAKWRYHPIDTQEIEEDYAVVRFRIDLGIRDFREGNLLAEGREGVIEGNAHMRLENDVWKVEKFEITAFSDENLRLADYFSYGGIQ